MFKHSTQYKKTLDRQNVLSIILSKHYHYLIGQSLQINYGIVHVTNEINKAMSLIQFKFKFELTKAYTNVRYQINVTNESRSILSNTCTFNRNVCSFYMNTNTKTVKWNFNLCLITNVYCKSITALHVINCNVIQKYM